MKSICEIIRKYLTILVLLNVQYVWSFYLPGLAPVNYCVKSDSSNSCKGLHGDSFLVALFWKSESLQLSCFIFVGHNPIC
ncbi:uncharacterized protein Tm9sf2_0 isoform X3 [Zeugodacus cucurbitae]|uniref:uncharacterized protein Tm9sf2_0 isoform X3 n=1 Tax=Zeugodacus cucurbitae TaxID=28588 RepID=UPI0023D944C0|nr:uncharacterized protein Tm9sf2_0 isoform X3 [Zeugodacus cucurbitae]